MYPKPPDSNVISHDIELHNQLKKVVQNHILLISHSISTYLFFERMLY